ncbi:hypothetical protein [Nostoc sp.]|uniref:hypothetical protein n=1 Tax=Nostoc sp. TaxID=1180 RepID=UPI002FFBEFA3
MNKLILFYDLRTLQMNHGMYYFMSMRVHSTDFLLDEITELQYWNQEKLLTPIVAQGYQE